MMRSLFSGVSGLKIHQTKMDVIGNNIANVNTIGFKSSSVDFSDVYYQKLQNATGPNANTGAAGTNAKQIGLGASLAAITVNVTGAGGTQRTERPLDLMINGDEFFVVESGGQTYFTKSGALGVDPSGNLYCRTNGANVMGWQADANGNVIKDTVSALRITSADRLYVAPEATTYVTMEGNLSRTDTNVAYDPDKSTGHVIAVSFFDRLGEQYSLRLSAMRTTNDLDDYKYTISVADIVDKDGKSILYDYDEASGTYTPTDFEFEFAGTKYAVESVNEVGEITWKDNVTPPVLSFTSGGLFDSINGGTRINFNLNPGSNPNNSFPNEGIDLDFSKLTGYGGTTSDAGARAGDANGNRAGYAAGSLDSFSIGDDGKIYGNYSNGLNKCFGQIALTTFANPSGLEAVGNSLFRTTLNSGEFDGIGMEPGTGSLSVGALEMSNVDLSTEFTSMITTQRGFQANSRIITTSDTILEELINLKR